jgi:proteasome assembly chaperone (PAC2) family protein
MDHTTLTHRPRLRRPFLLAAFEGWNDAGEAATTALDAVSAALDAATFATIDPEEFYDFQVSRPHVRLVDGVDRHIDWPAVELRAARLPGAERDLIVVRGVEPNLRWRTFAREIVEVAGRFGVEMLVTVGALLADVPHTRPVQVVGSTSDPVLADRLGLAPSNYEGPTGILGVVADGARRSGIPSVGLWAALPHYVNAVPNPHAALALIERLQTLLPLQVDLSVLRRQTALFDRTVEEAVAEDPELAGYVEQLEADAADESSTLADLPDQLVAEVERFLRDHPGGQRP